MADIYVATTGNDSTGDGSSGNPYLTIGKAITVMAGGDRILVKGPGTYSITAALTPLAGSPAAPSQIVGYKTTVGDLDGDSALWSDMPLVQVNNAAVTAILLSNAYQHVRNLQVDGAGGATKGTLGINLNNSYQFADHCKVSGFSAQGLGDGGGNGTTMRRCWVTGLVGSPSRAILVSASSAHVELCFATANPCPGIQCASAHASILRCVSAGNTGSGSHGFYTTGTVGGAFRHCVAYGNAGTGADGFNFANSGDSTDIASVYNCVSYGNAAYGLRQQNSGQTWTVFPGDYNAYGANGTAALSGVQAGSHDITLTGDPLASPAGSVTSLADLLTNYALNTTAGAGAACRAAGYPAYLDVGAIQHQDSAVSTTPAAAIRAIQNIGTY